MHCLSLVYMISTGIKFVYLINNMLEFIRYIYRGRDPMVVGFTTTYAISAYHHCYCDSKPRSGLGVQHYVIKFVSELGQVGGFLLVLWFPPPIKLTATI